MTASGAATFGVMLPSVEQTCFDVMSELFARDIDGDLLRRAQAKTPTERIVWLEEMQAFAEAAQKAARASRSK